MVTKINKIAPKLVSSTPDVSSSAINPHQNLVLTFDESVKAGSGYITISSGKDVHKIAITDKQVTISGTTVTINPTDDLLFNSHYTVKIDAAAINDLAGNKFGGKIFTFDTADTIAPVLRTTSPANGNKLVAVNRNIDFNFSEKIKLGSGNILLTHGTDVIKIPVNDPQVTISNVKLTLNPTTDFALGGVYTVSLDAGAVKDLAGNAFAGDSAGFTFYTKPAPVTHTTVPVVTPPVTPPVVTPPVVTPLVVTPPVVTPPVIPPVVTPPVTPPVVTPPVTPPVVTPPTPTIDLPLNPNDKTAPTLLSFTPQDNSLNVVKSANIVLNFNEAIKAGIGNIVLSGGNNDVRVIDIKDSTQVTISGKTITINPTADLKSNNFYSVHLNAGVVKDLSNNNFAGINDDTTFNFRTAIGLAITGKAIDGYLAGATVTMTGSDGKTYTTTTDANGNFSFPADTPQGSLTTSGGIDLSTGKAFNGVLTAPAGSTMITPLTTLQNAFMEATPGMTAEQAETKVATALGFTATAANPTFDLTKFDPIAAVKNGDAGAADLMASSAKVANLLVVASNTLISAGGSTVTSEQSWAALTKSLVNTIDSAANGKIDLADTTLLTNVLISSATEIAKSTTQVSLNLVSDISKVADTFATNLSTAAKNIDSVVSSSGDSTALLASIATVSVTTQSTDTVSAITPVVPIVSPVVIPPVDNSGGGGGSSSDTTPPTLSSSSPTDNATDVATTSNIVLTFSEAVQKGTGNIVVTNLTDNSIVTIPIAGDLTHGSVAISGSTVTINPTDDLKPSYQYSVKIDSTAIKDSSGNQFAGINNNTTLNFTTAAPAQTETSGNDVLNANQSSVLATAVSFDASQGNDEYVLNTVPVSGSLQTANIKINGFGSGDKLVFEVSNTAQGFSEVDALYSISDDTSDIKLIANDHGSVQTITLVGLSSLSHPLSVGKNIDTISELNTLMTSHGFISPISFII